MVELPRNPVHFKIDALSEDAVTRLTAWGYHAGKPKELPFHRVMPYMQELLDQGLVEHTGKLFNDNGDQIGFRITPTFDGFEAIEHLRCGLYGHHKKLYAEREAQGTHDEAIPGWGQF